jgi:hypothetical protein
LHHFLYVCFGRFPKSFTSQHSFHSSQFSTILDTFLGKARQPVQPSPSHWEIEIKTGPPPKFQPAQPLTQVVELYFFGGGCSSPLWRGSTPRHSPVPRIVHIALLSLYGRASLRSLTWLGIAWSVTRWCSRSPWGGTCFASTARSTWPRAGL